METISSNELTVKVEAAGAELVNITSNKSGREYLWQGDPTYWKRRSPVLFPIVGSLWNGEYRTHAGQTYPMSQHGFGRDMDFELIDQKPSEVSYRLKSNADTLATYPFHFELTIAYRLHANQLDVIWNVRNTGTETMPFQIGAHPAFNYADFDAQTDDRGYFAFDKADGLQHVLIAQDGCVDPLVVHPLTLNEEGLLPIDTHTFHRDALILQHSQTAKVALLDQNKNPYVTLHFDAPVVGLWSPPGKNAPFVCIEPWYGRCDSVGYTGSFNNRDEVTCLDADAQFEGQYTIEISQ